MDGPNAQGIVDGLNLGIKLRACAVLRVKFCVVLLCRPTLLRYNMYPCENGGQGCLTKCVCGARQRLSLSARAFVIAAFGPPAVVRQVNQECDVHSLCNEFPERLRSVISSEGDRLKK